ncbi:hypothetical protein [Brevibacillus dissolubilis]|uniref:hypothetical protein n=1 Tax=Brevibacillus dissolubilis TaxID=1844116 RepID=UPI0011166319|nr:hypothetical protein [Brevibacillus dissolubilis]
MSVKKQVLSVEPIYTGFSSIATCHYQNLANILEAQGLADARRKICLSWGFGWREEAVPGILYGGNRWADVSSQAFSLQLKKMVFDSWETASAYEDEVIAAGVPYVVEVDAFVLPSPYHDKEHVVHTVTVLNKEDGSVTILDNTNNPAPARYTLDHYKEMRSHPCEGREDPFVLYVSLPANPVNAVTNTAMQALLHAVERHWDQDVVVLDAFMEWAGSNTEPINVCRVAGEREYLQLLFQWFSEDHPNLAPIAQEFGDLADRWYLLHMMTANETTVHTAKRARNLRLLQELRQREHAFKDKVCEALRQELGQS